MKKSIIILTLCIVSLTTQAQEYEVKLIEIDSSAKYTLPLKPDSCWYLMYKDEILGFASKLQPLDGGFNERYEKNEKMKIHFYNGNTFEVEKHLYLNTDKNGSVLYVTGNKTIPYSDTSVLIIYNNKGEVIHKTEEYGYLCLWNNGISEDGYFVAYTKLKGKKEKCIVLYSPQGKLIFKRQFEFNILNLDVSNNGDYITALYRKGAGFYKEGENYFILILDKQNNIISDIIFSKSQFLSQISIIENKYIAVYANGFISFYDLKTGLYLFEVTDNRFYLAKESFYMLKDLNIVIVAPHNIYRKSNRIQNIFLIDMTNKCIITEIECNPFVKINILNDNTFIIQEFDKKLIYEISKK